MSSEYKGTIYAVLSGLFYGLIGYFGITLMNANFSAYNMLFWRFALSSLFIAAIILFNFERPTYKAKDFLLVVFCGIIFYSTSSITYFLSSKYIGSGLAMVITFTFPLFVMLLDWCIYKTKITKLYYLAVVIMLCGMVLLVDVSGVKLNLLGVILGIASAVLYAFYIIISKQVSHLPALHSTVALLSGSAISCLACALFDGSFVMPASKETWGNILAFSVFCTVLPILFFFEAMKYISSSKGAILSVLEPVFIVICGVALLGESISLVQVGGAIIVLSGAVLALL